MALHAGHLQPTSGGDELGPAVRGGGHSRLDEQLDLGRGATRAGSTPCCQPRHVHGRPAPHRRRACLLGGRCLCRLVRALRRRGRCRAERLRRPALRPAPHQPDARGVRRRRGDVTADHHRGGELRPRLARGLPGRHDPAGTARCAVHRDRPAVDHGCPHCAAGRSADAADPGISSIAVAAAPARRRGCAGRCGQYRPGDGCGPVGLRLSPRGGGPVDRHGRPAGVRLLGCSRDRPGSARGSDRAHRDLAHARRGHHRNGPRHRPGRHPITGPGGCRRDRAGTRRRAHLPVAHPDHIRTDGIGISGPTRGVPGGSLDRGRRHLHRLGRPADGDRHRPVRRFRAGSGHPQQHRNLAATSWPPSARNVGPPA